MSRTSIRTAAVVRDGDELTITGDAAEVGRILDEYKAEGLLAWWEWPVPTRTPGRVLVKAGLVSRRQAPAPRQTSPRTVAAVAAGAAVGVGMAGWLLLELMSVLAENIEYILGALVLAGGALVVVRKAASGGGGGRTFSGTFRGSMD